MLNMVEIGPPNCSKCNNVLSYFPIYQTLDFKAICGRCPISVTKIGPIRNIPFENAIRKTIFPCRYNNIGCKEMLYPHQVPQHESTCLYRLIKCPTLSFAKCSWRGNEEELIKHCLEIHTDYFIKDDTFKLDLTKSYGQYNFVKYEHDKLFLIFSKLRKQENSNYLSVAVMRCGHDNGQEFTCLVVITTGIRRLKVKVDSFVGGQFSPALDTEILLQSVAPDPSNQTTNVKFEIFDKISLSKDRIDAKLLLTNLECSICCTCMIPPIFLCLNGHSICYNCKDRINHSCPFCRSFVTDRRNAIMENMSNLPIYNCKFVSCKFTGSYDVVFKHQLFCIFRDNNLEFCSFLEDTGCIQSGSRVFLLNHMIAHHSDSFFESNLLEIESSKLRLNVSRLFILRYLDRLFELKLQLSKKVFKMTVNLNGLLQESNQFTYKFSMCHNGKVLVQSAGIRLGDRNKLEVPLDFLQAVRVSYDKLKFHIYIMK